MKRSHIAVAAGFVLVVVVAGLVWWRITHKPASNNPGAESSDPTAKWLLTATTGEKVERLESPVGFPIPTNLPPILKAVGCERANVGNFTFVRDGDRPGWEWYLTVIVPHKDASALQTDVFTAFEKAGYAREEVAQNPEFGVVSAHQFRRDIDRAEEIARVSHVANRTGSPDGSSGFELVWRVTSAAPAPLPTYAELTKAVPQLAPDRRGPIPIPEKVLALFTDQPVRVVSRNDANRSGYSLAVDVVPSDGAGFAERLRAVLVAEGFEPQKPGPTPSPFEYLSKRSGLAHCTIGLAQKDGFLRISLQVQTN